MRKEPLVAGNYYHILNRSIAQYRILEDTNDCLRFIQILDLYRFVDFTYKYSNFSKLALLSQKAIIGGLKSRSQKYVEIIAYCLMPTHFHLILKQITDDGTTKFVAKVLNSYSRYFNLRHKRKGPLWESHFKNVSIKTDDQILHLTRYIHLNPVSAGLVRKPNKWIYSSYPEYIGKAKEKLCSFDKIINVSPKRYQKFVSDRISYQKKLSKIKKILIDNYTG